MSAALAITRRNLTSAEMRRAASKSRDAKAARRMLALALVLEGSDRKTAAETCGIGPPDAARLGPSLQRRGAGRAGEPAGRSAAAAARRRTAGRVAALSGGEARLVARWVVRWRRQDLRANWLGISVFDDYDAIVEGLLPRMEPLRTSAGGHHLDHLKKLSDGQSVGPLV